jgi:hypothetical protein
MFVPVPSQDLHFRSLVHSITYNLKYECFSMAFDQIVQVNQPFVLLTVVELVTITVYFFLLNNHINGKLIVFRAYKKAFVYNCIGTDNPIINRVIVQILLTRLTPPCSCMFRVRTCIFEVLFHSPYYVQWIEARG